MAATDHGTIGRRRAFGAAERRVRRELHTLRTMIGMYCRARHGTRESPCAACGLLWSYAKERIDRCPLRDDKPTCLRCPIHCFRPEMRDRIRAVMRYAGPRMAWRHPILAALHLLDGRRPLPSRFRGGP